MASSFQFRFILTYLLVALGRGAGFVGKSISSSSAPWLVRQLKRTLSKWIDVFFDEDVQVVAIVKFEKYVAGARIFGVVVSELSYWQKPSPVILLTVNKRFDVCIHGAVLPLGLAVYLRIKGGRKLLLDVEKAFA